MKLDRVESPVVQKTVKKRQKVHSKKSSVTWGLLNLTLALIVYWEVAHGPTRIIMSSTKHLIVWYFEAGLCGVFSVSALIHALHYLSIIAGSAPVELNPLQWRLMGVRETEPGFVTPRKSSQSPQNSQPGLVISPSYQSPYSPTQPPFSTSLNYTPINSPHSAHSPARSLSPGSPGYYSPGSSFLHNSSLQGGVTPRYNGNSSSFNRSSFLGPASPSFRDDSSLGVRSRFSHSLKHSPLKSEDCIKDPKELEEFLHEQQEKDRKEMAGSPDVTSASGGGGASFWNYNRSLVDCYPLLRKYSYQLACRSPASAKVKDDDTDDGPAQYEANEVWCRVGVSVDDVDVWIEHLRKWLGQTVMCRLMQEIQAVNLSLLRHGAEDMQIGEMSISQLKQLALAKAQQVPTLNRLLPFLEVSANQEYLIARINELGSGGCMSDFRWNSGSEFKGKPWAENLPTDAQIVMHVLCSYMDARLPGHPKYYGKTFSTLHFLQTPDKPDLEKKDNMIIWQTKMNPPHYKVVLGDDVWNLPKGRNNMFMAILLFLHHVKEKQHGMLGRVNLGLSGINILWILEKHL